MTENKNILIINTGQENNQLLFDIFSELRANDFNFYLLGKRNRNYNLFKLTKKIYLGPELKNNFNIFLFCLIAPLFWLRGFYTLLLFLKERKIKTIVCCYWNEKIIFSSLAKILRLKIIWLEYPDTLYGESPRLLLFFYKLLSRRAIITVLNEITKTQLKRLGIKNQIILAPLGIKLNKFSRQDSIFSGLAKIDKENYFRKYFTVGAIVNSGQANQVENLFWAVKKCLTVINNLQLIIVGDPEERKKLTWLVKKLEIDSLVWFVGEAAVNEKDINLQKWLDSFDVFCLTCQRATLFDLHISLRAMATGLAIIGPRNQGFEDLITENKNGLLIESNNSDILAGEIINLFKNKRLKHTLGKNALEAINQNHKISRSASYFAGLFS